MSAGQSELELGTGERIPIAESLTIGRSTEADLVLADVEASRKHCQIRKVGNAYLISDLASRNGTTVNGEAVTESRTLRDGDEIRLGKTSLVFRAAADAVPETLVLEVPAIEPTLQFASIPMTPMQVLGRISRQISGIVDAKQLADAVTSAIKEEYGCEGASLILVDEDADELYFASVASTEPVTLQLMTLKRGEGIAGDVIERQTPVVVANVSRASNHAAALDQALGFETRSIVAAPVTGPDGEILGALEAVNPLRKPAFDNDDLEFISLVAGQLGVALVNARSWDAIERERTALSRVAGIRRDFIATAPATIRLVAEVAAMHAQRVPVYLCGEPGTGKRLLVQLTHQTSEDSGEVVEIDGGAGLPSNIDDLVRESTVYVSRLEMLSVDAQERLAAAISAANNQRPTYASGSVTLLTMLSAGKLAPSLHAAFEAGQRILSPLRNRLEDLEAIVEHEVSEVTTRLRRGGYTFSADGFARMREYSWPGNIAELGAIVRRIGILSRDAVVELPQLDELAPELVAESLGIERGTDRPGAIERKTNARIALAQEALNSGTPSQWNESIEALASISGPAPVPVLTGLLNSPDAGVRAKAAIALRGRPDGVGAVASQLESETDPGVAVALVETIRGSGDPLALEAVEARLFDPDLAVRRQALRALRGSDTEPVRRAAEAAARDSDPNLRAEGLAAQWGAGNQEASEQLLNLLDDASAEIATATIRVCGELNLGPSRLLAIAQRGGDPLRRIAAIRALASTHDDQWGTSVRGLLGDASIRVEAILALGELGSAEAQGELAELAASDSAPLIVRRSALIALGKIRTGSAIDVFRACLEDPELREAAIQGLISLANPESEGLLIGQLPAASARLLEIVGALAVFGSDSSIGALLRAGAAAPQFDLEVLRALVAIWGRSKDKQRSLAALESELETEEVRLLGLQLLGEVLDPRATPTLLKYREWSQEARIALGRLGPRAMPELLIALQTPNRSAAEETLAEIGTEGVPYLLPLLSSPELGRAAARVIQAVGEAALPALLDAAERRTSEIVPAVLQLIGRVGSGRLAAYVAGFLESASPGTRYAAIIALGDLADSRGEESLIELMESPDTITAGLATLALGRTQSARAFELILPRLGVGDRRLAYASAGAIGNFNLRQPSVLALVRRSVREGMPVSAAAVEAAFRANATDATDFVAALNELRTSRSQKLRLIAILGQIPSELAIPVLCQLLSSPEIESEYESQLVASLVRHEADATTEIVGLLTSEGTRRVGLRVLEAMQEPRGLLSVLRSVSPSLENDEDLRAALREKGDQLLGPLLDIIYDNWDLATLGLLWQLSEVVEVQTGETPQLRL